MPKYIYVYAHDVRRNWTEAADEADAAGIAVNHVGRVAAVAGFVDVKDVTFVNFAAVPGTEPTVSDPLDEPRTALPGGFLVHAPRAAEPGETAYSAPEPSTPKGRGRTAEETTSERVRLEAMLAGFRGEVQAGNAELDEAIAQTEAALRDLGAEVPVAAIVEDDVPEPADLVQARRLVGYYAGLVAERERLTGVSAGQELAEARAALRRAQADLERIEKVTRGAEPAASDVRVPKKKAAKRAPGTTDELTEAQRAECARVEAEIEAIDREIPLDEGQ